MGHRACCLLHGNVLGAPTPSPDIQAGLCTLVFIAALRVSPLTLLIPPQAGQDTSPRQHLPCCFAHTPQNIQLGGWLSSCHCTWAPESTSNGPAGTFHLPPHGEAVLAVLAVGVCKIF